MVGCLDTVISVYPSISFYYLWNLNDLVSIATGSGTVNTTAVSTSRFFRSRRGSIGNRAGVGKGQTRSVGRWINSLASPGPDA